MPAVLTPEQIHAFRQRLCAVATRQFAERGTEGVSMRSLAEELGCSATAPYRYFENKEAILAAVRAAALDRLSDAMQAAMATPGDVWAKSRAIGDAYVRFAFDDPSAYRLIFALSQPDESRYPELAAATERSRRAMVEYVELMVAAGALDGDPEVIGQLFWAGMHGLIVLFMAGKLGSSRDDFEKLRHEMMRLIVRGAAPGSGTAADSSPARPETMQAGASHGARQPLDEAG